MNTVGCAPITPADQAASVILKKPIQGLYAFEYPINV